MFSVQVKGASVGARVFRHRSKITGKVVEYTPERGMISIYSEKDGKEHFERVSRREFAFRAAALSLEVKRMKYGDERLDQQRLLDQMVLAGQAAGAQGDPFDPRVTAHMARARPTQRVLSPGLAATRYDPGVPAMPQAPAGKAPASLGGTQVTTPSGLIIPARARA